MVVFSVSFRGAGYKNYTVFIPADATRDESIRLAREAAEQDRPGAVITKIVALRTLEVLWSI